jgi:hypothetical protein
LYPTDTANHGAFVPHIMPLPLFDFPDGLRDGVYKSVFRDNMALPDSHDPLPHAR